MTQATDIKIFLLKNIPRHPSDIVARASSKFGVSRVTIHRHLSALLRQGKVMKSGTTRAIQYYLVGSKNKMLHFALSAEFDESDVWFEHFRDDFSSIDETITDICDYGFTEIVNNAKDHSRGTKVTISSHWKQNNITFIIEDNGIGIFSKLKAALNYENYQEALLRLSMGKLTTDPQNHTGEGIFFTSRAFDYFEAQANSIKWYRDNIQKDWFFETMPTTTPGTRITLVIDTHSKRDIIELFKEFQNPETLEFDKTEAIVELAKLQGERYISRPQAKRITEGLTKFNRIILDFKHVRVVGQGFVDEQFRVYQNKHPEKQIEYRNANSDVEFMITHSLSTKHSTS